MDTTIYSKGRPIDQTTAAQRRGFRLRGDIDAIPIGKEDRQEGCGRDNNLQRREGETSAGLRENAREAPVENEVTSFWRAGGRKPPGEESGGLRPRSLHFTVTRCTTRFIRPNS